MLRHCTLTVAAIVALAADNPAPAQTQRSGGESQKIMQQYQQLAAERSALQEQLAQARKDLDDAKADLAATKKERDALKSRTELATGAIAQANTSKQATEQSLELYKQRITELVTRFRETAQTLKEVESDRAKARQELSLRDSAFDKCAENNLQLYEISADVLNRYERVGFFTKASATEPFTQITRTRIDNLVDDYRARAQELRVKQRKPNEVH